MRRGIPAAAVTLGLTLALTACSGSGNDTSGDPTSQATGDGAGGSLVVWVDETRQGAVESAAAAFESENGVDVELVLKNFEDIRADFLAQVPTGEGPDISVGGIDRGSCRRPHVARHWRGGASRVRRRAAAPSSA